METSDRLTIAGLMLGLFRGRVDQVAVEWERDGKVGFSPRQLPRPMDPDWIARRHLSGEQGLGFYLMDPSSRVFCTCADFDNKSDKPDPQWRDKAEAVHVWLSKAGLSPLTEISQSGTAAHVWLFFDEPTDAWIARAYWRLTAEKTGVPIPEVYPRQDALTGKELGNLVRYPLWKQSRFVDPESEWAIVEPAEALAGVTKTNGPELQAIALEMGHGLQKPTPLRPPPPVTDGSPTLPPRVAHRLSRKGSLLERRWHGDMTGLKDQSRSALVLSIATDLVRNFVLTDEIETALRVWCAENDYEKGQRPDWIRGTVSKAYEAMFSRMEERSSTATTMELACNAYLDTIESGQCGHISSGLADLDQSIDGVAFGEMAVIAARPGHGKSAFALQWLDNAALAGHPCLLISEEMATLELGKRGVTYCSALEGDRWDRDTVSLLRGDVREHYRPRKPIYVVENCNSIQRVEDVVDQFVAIQGVRLVAVDYLQLLAGRGEKRYDQVTDVSRRLKQMAKRNNICLLALSQLNREIESRSTKEPQLSDLRESGQLEQDCDLAIFLTWPYRYDNRAPEFDYQIHIRKRRNGPIRKQLVETWFNANRQAIGPEWRPSAEPSFSTPAPSNGTSRRTRESSIPEGDYHP